MNFEKLIACDLNLPDHTKEIKKTDLLIENIKTDFRKVKNNRSLNTDNYKKLYQGTIQLLDYLGRLSTPAFKIEEKLERVYLMKYSKTPTLGRQLWWEHYERIHEPYSDLKNKCFKLIETLNKEYKYQNKIKPPTWEDLYQ